MDWTPVKTQAEFDAALAGGARAIEISAAVSIDIRVPDGVVLAVKTAAGSLARVLSGSVEAWESSSVEARGSSRVVARESSRVEAWGSSRVVALESSSVEAWGSSSVEAWGSSSVVARESSRVVAWGSSSVVAWGSSSVEARESSSVVALESSSVVAWGAAALSIFGGMVKAVASAMVGVHLHRGAKCDGGVQIVVTPPSTPEAWCEYYGVTIEGDCAVLYKGVSETFNSPHGATYKPGTESKAADWDGGTQECGRGLHFSPCPAMTLEFNSEATKFVACLVPLTGIAVHPDGQYPQKVKAESCWNCYECDRFGDMIGEKFDRPTTTTKKVRAAKRAVRKHK